MPSILKVNQIQKTSSTSNIINKSGSTITLGASGTTISLACGATSSGFAASSFVDWCTTAKTAPFTGANGTGYFVNTSCGAITVTLPATPTTGDIVSLKDYGGTWATNSVTVCNNGSKINGVCATATLNTNSQSVTLIYVDATKGWQDIQDSTAAVSGNPYIVATGGTVTTCGDYKIHIFTSDATFTVCSAGTPTNAYVDYLVVAGGAAGGQDVGGGGGAGGLRIGAVTVPGCAPPVVAPGGLPVTATSYPITVGGGGASAPTPGTTAANGSNSIFSTITSTGGGGGGSYQPPPGMTGASGGSGGGGSGVAPSTGGAGNTPPTSPSQGNPGGGTTPGGAGAQGGGGGGASAAGVNGINCQGGAGGSGTNVTSIFGASPKPYYAADVPTAGPTSTGIFAGGGGGGPRGPAFAPGHVAQGGDGGGGDGRENGTETSYAGVANSGGGGGAGPGGASPQVGASGGSGIVILRYRYQ